MKTLAIFAVALIAASSVQAFAGVLPITGKYCEGDVNVDGTMLDASAIWSEDEVSMFDRVVKSGPNWWVVTYQEVGHDPDRTRLELSRDKKTITVSGRGLQPYTLTRCK